MAVVVFDPNTFKAAFPEFAAVPDVRLTLLFNLAAAGILDNTDASPVTDMEQRAALFQLLVAHLLTLFGTTVAGTAGNGPIGIVGRTSSATEGSVSTSLEYNVPTNPSAAWFNQTQYGAMYWLMLAPFRSFRYIAFGQSGIGRAVNYLDAATLAQLRGAGGGQNSGTPGGA